MNVKVIRKYAVQGHLVPAAAYRPSGPFPAEVLARPRMTLDVVEKNPNSHRVFRCRDCGELTPWDSLQDHDCEDMQWP